MAGIEPGRILAGKYRVERILGSGGMGVVVLATHLTLDEPVAVKLLRPEHLEREGAADRVLREARATVKIASEHVVRVLDAGMLEDGAPYIAMEYLEGWDLAQLLCAEGKVAPAEAAGYLLEACDAIGRAHALGIVHRDLKPANLFLCAREKGSSIKVLDFGISKLLSPTDSQDAPKSARSDGNVLTRTAAIIGSPVYMSPEQLESSRDVDARTDIWSLGVVLYELVTGEHPFTGESLPALVRKIAEHPAPLLREARPDAPEALEAIVRRCLQKKREDRYPDIASLAADLANVAAMPRPDEVAATRLEASRRTIALQSSDTGLARSHRASELPPQRSRRLIGLGAVVALGVAGSAFAMHRTPKTPEPRPVAPAATMSVLACPQLEASGVEAPAGWLGAAASSVVCLRAQMRMGGRSSRTLVPAELLDLPRVVVDDFPEDPFGGDHAREKSLAAAVARAPVYLDGEIVKEVSAFRVTLILRSSAGGGEIARGEAKAPTFFSSVKSAMEPLEKGGFIPSARDDDPFLVEWLRVRTADAAVATIDRRLAAFLDSDAEQKECATLLDRRDVLPDLAHAIRVECDDSRSSKPSGEPVPRDASSPGSLRIALVSDPGRMTRPAQPDVDALERTLGSVDSSEGRALLLESESHLFGAHDDLQHATDAALRSVREDPKAMDGIMSAWATLSWFRANSNAAPAAMAWAPWMTEAMCFSATRSPDPEVRVKFTRREHAISPENLWTTVLAESLLGAGKRDEARSVAAETPWQGIHILIAASDARFKSALDLGFSSLEPGTPTSNGPFMALYALSYLAEVAALVDAKTDFIDDVMARYAKPEIADRMLMMFNATWSCLFAAPVVAQRCLARIRKIATSPIGFVDGLLEGAERYAAEDWAGAARAWRPMLSHPSWQLEEMREFMAIAFDRTGDLELAEAADAPFLKNPGRFNGAEAAHVRAAQRAYKRGDLERARRFAKTVIEAWSVADMEVPAVAEMRKLLVRLR